MARPYAVQGPRRRGLGPSLLTASPLTSGHAPRPPCTHPRPRWGTRYVLLRLYPHNKLPGTRRSVDRLCTMAATAAEVGFDGVMTSEHHGGFAVYLPNPLPGDGLPALRHGSGLGSGCACFGPTPFHRPAGRGGYLALRPVPRSGGHRRRPRSFSSTSRRWTPSPGTPWSAKYTGDLPRSRPMPAPRHSACSRRSVVGPAPAGRSCPTGAAWAMSPAPGRARRRLRRRRDLRRCQGGRPAAAPLGRARGPVGGTGQGPRVRGVARGAAMAAFRRAIRLIPRPHADRAPGARAWAGGK